MPSLPAEAPPPWASELDFDSDFERGSHEGASDRESGTRWRVMSFAQPAPGKSIEEAPPPPPLRFPDDRGHHPARRKRAIKARTIDLRRLPEREDQADEVLFEAGPESRPHRREDCKGGARPCPWVSCRYHLYLDVSPRTGSLKLNFPDLEVWELEECCALDVADRGQAGSEQIGSLLNVTRERARQLEEEALQRARTKIG